MLGRRALVQLACTELSIGHVDEGLARCRQALDEMERRGDRRGQATALRVLSDGHNQAGECDEGARRPAKASIWPSASAASRRRRPA